MGLVELLIIIALVFINGFFVAAEFALVKVRTSQIDQLAEEGSWAAKLTSRALDNLDAYQSASQVGITVASLALGWAIKEWFEKPIIDWLRTGGLGERSLAIGTLRISLVSLVPVFPFTFVTFLHVALGEQAPKSLAIRSAKAV